MQFIYILQLLPKYRIQANWTDETNQTLNEHWNYLVSLHEKGVMQLVGRTALDISNDDNRGIAIFEAESAEKATEIMNNDPCVKNGVMNAQLHPFNIALMAGKKHG